MNFMSFLVSLSNCANWLLQKLLEEASTATQLRKFHMLDSTGIVFKVIFKVELPATGIRVTALKGMKVITSPVT